VLALRVFFDGCADGDPLAGMLKVDQKSVERAAQKFPKVVTDLTQENTPNATVES